LIETDVEMIQANADRCIAKGSVEKIGTDEAVRLPWDERKHVEIWLL
jgi:hypothetical protein